MSDHYVDFMEDLANAMWWSADSLISSVDKAPDLHKRLLI